MKKIKGVKKNVVKKDINIFAAYHADYTIIETSTLHLQTE